MKKGILLKAFLSVILPVFVFALNGTEQRLLQRSVEKPGKIKKLTQSQLDQIGQKAELNTKLYYPQYYKKLLQKSSSERESQRSAVGDTMVFHVLNIENSTFYDVTAVLKAQGVKTQVWVDTASWNKLYVTQSIADDILLNLEHKTGTGSVNPDTGIYYIDVEYFGEPPNVDGDGIVDFLLTDIQDGWTPGSGSYIAGFFTSRDQGNMTGSNHRDMLYLDTYPAIYYNGNYNTQGVLGTTSHEFQHCIHYNYDTSEETYFNEAMSQLAATLCGYGLDNPGYFLADPNHNLTDWSGNQVGDSYFPYTLVNLWSEYMFEQFGKDFIKNAVQRSSNGATAIDEAMQALGIQSSFDESYQNWILANYINDTTVDPKWGYTHPDAQGLRATTETSNTYPAQFSGSVKEYGALYYSFTLGNNLALTYTSGNGFAKLIRYTNNGVEVSDLTSGQEYTDSEFGTTTTKDVVVTGSIANDASFTLDADASNDLLVEELSHDDGTPDPFGTGFTYLGTGDSASGYGWGVKYYAPEASIRKLLKITIKASGTGNVLLHVWNADDPSGFGTDIVNPVQVSVASGDNEFDVPALFGQDVNLPDSFLVGFTHADEAAAVYVGMDNSDPTNYTWLYRPSGNHATLTDLGASYQGYNMMMHAIIGYQITEPVVFSAGILQNPLFSENLDIMVLGGKKLLESSLSGTAILGTDTTQLDLVQTDNNGMIFADNDYTLNSTGTLKINLSGKYVGSVLAPNDTTFQWQVAFTSGGQSSRLQTEDGQVHVQIPADAVSTNQYILLSKGWNTISKEETQIKYSENPAFSLLVPGGEMKKQAQIRISPENGSGTISGKMIIARLDGNRLIGLQTSYDSQSNEYIGYTSHGGQFVLVNRQDLNPSQVPMPSHFMLEQNYPNPFNPSTVIRFSTIAAGHVQLEVFNVMGQKIKTLINKYMEASEQTVNWDGTDMKGNHVPSGIYIYKLTANGQTMSRKMVLIR